MGKVFRANCGEVKRKAFTTARGTKVKALICEAMIDFQPSLKEGISIAHCPECHTMIYRESR